MKALITIIALTLSFAANARLPLMASGSDDYKTWGDRFDDAAALMVHKKLCTREDFKSQGGFTGSADMKRARKLNHYPLYFVWCQDGGAKYYFEPNLGTIYRKKGSNFIFEARL